MANNDAFFFPSLFRQQNARFVHLNNEFDQVQVETKKKKMALDT